ncbi:MAG: UvrABC system protein A [Candidatus Collierbacteria bacterium GW2011_GWB1_45_35]|uniref:UvrABC system protein A n=2 Tax=Candidatus Collieribacteriota TaxID=1752725 RepID=A0A837IEL3_9BACT|nr:MAG: UvrABC system protein A [Microgenomates group bacterium GW2011_GWC1_44_23]KKT95719.1 MAG: UvrABC system protein A [Candidatus Collierbacteria bacterium GW2011_GWA1_45_15]KKU00366.1 MAG: UvrABC system protein A [Candidatus Collierbacteria bacterium GW2011_GWB2_45_17]KKU05818.1 MAG: UvrABC system protein A [Candidatus Collierbacteria bacterium GW2011_GWB1_45_35]KKU08367.1 MAG: UvrABC system protein A [Candidatus Collierbacteria bacterium GW2011_GWC2_45_40]HBC44728.1 excinuclease ABC subu
MSVISPSTHLIIKGARQHNLKNVNLTLPKNKLVVFTGVSGSGKSSMAHDTIYAEGQRRYVESLSSYARQFLGVMDKPDVDQIEGLSPAILIDQKQGSHNPRSTVGTVTEIYDYLRLLFARIGHPHCPKCSREILPQDINQIYKAVVELAVSHPSYLKQKGVRLLILAPIVKGQKGEFKELFPGLSKQGIQEVRVDNKILSTQTTLSLFKNNRHNIEAVIDKLVIGQVSGSPEYEKQRLVDSLEQALKISDGEVFVSLVTDPSLSFPENPEEMEDHLFSQKLACPVDNISIPEIEPRYFSFNAPEGACPECTGLGTKMVLDTESVVSPSLSLLEGAIIPLASQFESRTWLAKLVLEAMESLGFPGNKPLLDLTTDQKQALFTGTGSKIYSIKGINRHGKRVIRKMTFDGLSKEFERRYEESNSVTFKEEISKYLIRKTCPVCLGTRLKPEVLAVHVNNHSISELTSWSTSKSADFFQTLSKKLTSTEQQISEPILKEIGDRLSFLMSVGLDYITLARESGTLSGGELQRIRLASQIGSRLTGILYVLDEPTIGLHQRDNAKLIKTLKDLVTLGNSLVVVEHDQQTMESADHLVEFGPKAGYLGGRITFEGSIDEMKNSDCLTGQYLSGKKSITAIKPQNPTESPASIRLTGCTHHNLKDVDVEFPLNKFITVTGVSGSGKSSLVVDTLYEALSQKLNPTHRKEDIKFGTITIPDIVKRVSLIDQSPIGKTPRSNPATYTKVFDYVRQLFANTQEARYRGYGPGRFSFNVKGGRCETCEGDGQLKIEMQFLGDIYITCETCKGSRFNDPTLEIEYKDKSIAQILDMTMDQAGEFFRNIPAISKKIETIKKVGLGYIKMGQSAPTLSGGEAQRVKLATELAKTGSGHTIYILDEPTTGLHFDDLSKLVQTLVDLVNQNNTVIVIEHNLDVIKNADYIIDIGPEGGDAGGELIASGSPTKVTTKYDTPTAQELKKIIH